MSLGNRIREWLDTGGGQPRRRPRAQAQPITPHGYEHRPLQRGQWIGLGLAAASAVALTAGLVFIILTLTRPSDPRPTPGATPGAVAVASPTVPVSAIFATSTPTVVATPTLPPRGERLQVANTEGEGVNLRREPSTTAERLKILPEGSLVDVIGPEQEAEGFRWRQVQDAEGTLGWVPSRFLVVEGTAPIIAGPTPDPRGATPGAQTTAPGGATPATKPTASRAQVGNTNGQGANIRSEPGAGGRVLKTLAEGTPVEALGPEREVDGRIWRQVRDSTGVTGWIIGGALVAPGTVPTPAPPGARPTAAGTAAPATGATPIPGGVTPGPAPTTAPTAAPTAPAGGPTVGPPVLIPPRPGTSPTPTR